MDNAVSMQTNAIGVTAIADIAGNIGQDGGPTPLTGVEDQMDDWASQKHTIFYLSFLILAIQIFKLN